MYKLNELSLVKMAPDSLSSDEEILNEMGHIWYADQSIGNFIEKVESI